MDSALKIFCFIMGILLVATASPIWAFGVIVAALGAAFMFPLYVGIALIKWGWRSSSPGIFFQ